ncbi:MAG: TetR family transcriptional regulator [Methylocella sp.]
MRLIVTRDLKMMRGLSDIKEKYIRLQTHLGEAPGPREDHSPADARRDGQDMRTATEPSEREPSEKEAKGSDTRRLIVEVAERLFRQLGFQKTTVADIARELHMSPANVYRFFGAKSEINAAVCMDLLGKIEAEAGKIAASRGAALQRLRTLVTSVEKAHRKQYMFDRKLHELIEAAMTENWAIMREHNQRMTGMLEQVVASGMAAGEFHPGDAALAARLVNTACIRFCHPRLMGEYEQEPEPALDDMLDFCLAALVREPV